MRNVVQLKKAKVVEVGEYVLNTQHGSGLLLARKVVKVEPIEEGRVELGTDDKRLHVVNGGDVVVVVV